MQQLSDKKIASMVESKDFRKGIVQLEWSVLLIVTSLINVKFAFFQLCFFSNT